MSALTLLLLLCLSLGGDTPARTPNAIVITDVTVIDATGAAPKSGVMVVITGNRITALGQAGQVRIPAGAQVVKAKGKFLIPGLWDMHVHILNQLSRRPPNTWYFPLFVANGVTSVREMWTKPEDMDQVREWRKLYQEGSLLAPRIAAVGTLVDGPAGAQTTSPGNSLPGPTAHIAATTDEAREFVRQVKAAGIDFIKPYSSLDKEVYRALADEARKLGIPFAGHVPFAVNAFEASSAGQRSMEHLNQILESVSSKSQELFQVPGRDWSLTHEKLMLDTFDDKRLGMLIAVLARNETWQVPTLVNAQLYAFQRDLRTIWNDRRLRYIPAHELETWKKLFSDREREPTGEDKHVRTRLWQKQLDVVRRMHKVGVPFLAGTDMGTAHIYPGGGLHDELTLLVEADFTPMEALQTATRNPAQFLGLSDSLGTVEQGKIADLVLLDADPLEDIRNTQKIRAVIVNGRYLDRSALDKLLAEAEVAVNKSRRGN
ncbi:MAG: amidohydrolase family protein [Acidobacteria bacterium]|nr:amidohydrolase family protein [Acidobacteriota bacterium]